VSFLIALKLFLFIDILKPLLDPLTIFYLPTCLVLFHSASLES
jgi:hypothetical protein